MKIGVFSVIMSDLPLEEALGCIAGLGCQTVEFACGGYPGNSHCNPAELIRSKSAFDRFHDTVLASGLEISALSCHGNPLHPDRRIAAAHHKAFVDTVRLAGRLGIDTVVTFSGCPGDHAKAKAPNWVTCAWPPDYLDVLEWQWSAVAVPYWTKAAAFAAMHGVSKIAIEAHPGFLVYNPATLLRLRQAVGGVIGANFDPSHFFWQGIDPVMAVRKLEGAIHHVHMRDTALYPANAGTDGYLDTNHNSDEKNSSWLFRTVGYGHGREFWCDFVSALRMCGYDGVLSMNHKDSLMCSGEGLRKGVEFLQEIVIREPKDAASWH